MSQGSLLKVFSLAFFVFMCDCSISAQDSVYREFFYPDGVISSKGYFIDGQPDGYWENFHPNGVVKSKGKRSLNQLDSVWKFYDPNGCITSEINYLNGKKNGYYFSYQTIQKADSIYPTLLSKELYVNNIKEGTSSFYHLTGYLKETIPYLNGKEHGTAFYFDSLGTVIAYAVYQNGIQLSHENVNRIDSAGNKVGIWKQFHPNGSVAVESNYQNGSLYGYSKRFNRNSQLLSAQLYQADSLVTDSITNLSFIEPVEYLAYFPNGQPRERGLFKDSVPIGVHRLYDSLGSVIASDIYNEFGVKESTGIFTDNGIKQGFWIFYYPSGAVYKEGSYRSGLEYGTWKFYYSDGVLRETGTYIDGAFSGTWVFYHSNGNILRQIEYFEGLEEGLCTEYDDSSNVIAEGMFVAGKREGNWKIVTGNITMQGSYRAGDKVGNWQYTYDNGKYRFVGNYRLGNPHGKHRYYFEDGTLEREELWKSGKRTKVWRYYRSNGTLEMMIFYKRGKEQQIVFIDEGQ